MIDPLSVNQCRAAHEQIEQPLRVELPFDLHKIDNLVRAHRELFQTTAQLHEHVRVRELTTQMLPACAGLDMLGGDLDTRFGLSLADIWLAHNGYLLLPAEHERTRLFEMLTAVPKLPLLPLDTQLVAVRTWVGSNVAEAATGRALAGQSGTATRHRPIQSFVACPLTNVPPAEKRFSRDLCDTAASVMSEFGILTLQPVLYTSAEVTPVDINDPGYRSTDERKIAESEIVLVVAVRTSYGLGGVAYTANRYRKHLVFAATGGTVSPMIMGLEPAPTVIRLGSLESDLRRHLETALPAIEAWAARTRRELSEIEVELERLRQRFAAMATVEFIESHEFAMNPARLRELISCPELFAGATVLELRELYSLVGES